MKVMIVDDELDIRESLQEFFEDEGYVVSTAANGALALELLERESLPCVVILDIMMPVLGGKEMYERMQSDPRLASVPVVVSTSDPSKAPSGVPIMRKPIDLERLLGTVRQHCAG